MERRLKALAAAKAREAEETAARAAEEKSREEERERRRAEIEAKEREDREHEEMLRAKGTPAALRVGPGGRSWSSWRSGLGPALAFLGASFRGD